MCNEHLRLPVISEVPPFLSVYYDLCISAVRAFLSSHDCGAISCIMNLHWTRLIFPLKEPCSLNYQYLIQFIPRRSNPTTRLGAQDLSVLYLRIKLQALKYLAVIRCSGLFHGRRHESAIVPTPSFITRQWRDMYDADIPRSAFRHQTYELMTSGWIWVYECV